MWTKPSEANTFCVILFVSVELADIYFKWVQRYSHKHGSRTIKWKLTITRAQQTGIAVTKYRTRM